MNTHWINNKYTLNKQWIPLEYTLDTHWINNEYTLNKQQIHIEYILNTHWIHIEETMNTYWINNQGSTKAIYLLSRILDNWASG